MKKKYVFSLLVLVFLIGKQAISQVNNSSVELRHINKNELNKMSFDVSKLAKGVKESYKYVVDENGNIFFLVEDKVQLVYHVTRVYNDNDLINKVSKKVFYILDVNSTTSLNKIETVKVDLSSKKIIQ